MLHRKQELGYIYISCFVLPASDTEQIVFFSQKCKQTKSDFFSLSDLGHLQVFRSDPYQSSG